MKPLLVCFRFSKSFKLNFAQSFEKAKYGLGNESKTMLGIIYSDWVTINHGVPKVAVLETLIFVLYINDLSETMKSGEFLQFANDTY